MPFDPSKYVFQPRPLQQYDFSSAWRDLANARLERSRVDNQNAQAGATLAEQQQSRADENTRFAATLASNQNAAARAAAIEKHQKVLALIDAARKAANTGDWNTTDAIGPRVVEMGGKFSKKMGPGGYPIYEISAPNDPSQSDPDYAGTRAQVFGGAPGGGRPPPSSSNGGPQQPPPGKNPFDALPGSSAAAIAAPPGAPAPGPQTPPPGAAWLPPSMGQQGPPPGAPPAAPGAPPPQPPGAPPAPAAPPAPGGAPPPPAPGSPPPVPPPQAAAPDPSAPPQPPGMQLTGPNPFDPFKIDTSQVGAQNKLRLQPYFEGATGAFPKMYQGRVQSLNDGAAALNLPPEETLKLWQPTLNTAAGLMKSELMATQSGARMAQSQENMGENRNMRLEDRTTRNTSEIAKSFDLFASKKRVRDADATIKLLDLKNPQGDVQAITQLRNMYQTGVMTDNDFKNAKTGMLTVFDALQRGVSEQVIASGMNPDTRREMKEFLRFASTQQRQNILQAMDQMMVQVEMAGSTEERQAALKAIMGLIPRQYWTDEVRQAFGEKPLQKSGPVDREGNVPIGPKGNGSKSSSSASVHKKDVKPMTPEELDKSYEELMRK